MGKVMIGVLMMAVFALAGPAGCSREDNLDASKKEEKTTVAVTPWPGSAAVYVAEEKGYFRDEGLDVDLHSYISGHLGLAAVLSGKADLATVGDTPISRAVVEGEPVAVVGTICEINRAILIVARRDRGISSPEDLKGKKIGVVAGTTADFFLHLFLAASYISPWEVWIINLETDQVVDALVKGEIDAVSTWSPHTTAAGEKLGDNGIILEDPSIYKMTWNLTATKDFAVKHRERIQRVLRAIIRANRFIVEQPGEARAITSMEIDTDRHAFDKEWEDFRFTATLDQSLLLNLEDQARWMIREEIGDGGGLPSLIDFIDVDSLKAVQPAAVGIIGR